jgi:electron transport complex protein RnfB
VELRVLKKIFSPDEASMASQLTGSMESVEVIAERVGLSPEETKARLVGMTKRGLLWTTREGDEPLFRLAPFVVGIYESQRESMDHELAHLVEEYMAIWRGRWNHGAPAGSAPCCSRSEGS